MLGLLGLAAFLWALKSGQFDDLEGAALRILEDDEDEKVKEKETSLFAKLENLKEFLNDKIRFINNNFKPADIFKT